MSPPTAAATLTTAPRATAWLQQQAKLNHHYSSAASARLQSRTHTHTNPSAYNGPSRAQTAPRNRAFSKQIMEPTSVFHVFLNPEISVVDRADLHTGFPEN